MTRQETFKKRVRERMRKTGERYAAARRALLTRAAGRNRVWAAEPEAGDDAVRRATGRGWDAWCDVIEAWPGRTDGHTAIARYLREEHGVSGWWAQAVTGGYERIVGIRVPHQMPDGTFTANKSKTVDVPGPWIDEPLRDPDAHADLFPERQTEILSRPGTRAVRIAFDEGVATIAVEPRGEGRTRVTVQHARLPDAASVERWKFFWQEWLEAVS